jgi:hypothetical protein
MLKFLEEGHKYESVTPDGRKWLGVTTLISKYKKPFDSDIVYKNVADPASKWYGMDPQEVLQIWKNEANRSTTVGSWFHKRMEDREVNAINCCPIQQGWKYAGDQVLQPGVYPEFFTYNALYALCGQADRVECTIDNHVNIGDYKTNKKLETTGFRGKKMLTPIDYLDDCHLSHYSLQMSIYMWMILQHNPQLRPGSMTIFHIKFGKEGVDANGYPIIAKDENGDYVVESVTPIVVPYLEKEVLAIVQNLQTYP